MYSRLRGGKEEFTNLIELKNFRVLQFRVYPGNFVELAPVFLALPNPESGRDVTVRANELSDYLFEFFDIKSFFICKRTR